MPARKLVLLLVALLIGGGTVFLARSMMTGAPSGGTATTAATVKTTEVLVASRDLPVGTLIKDADLKWKVWPEESATTGFAVKGQEDLSAYAGAVVRQSLRADEPIMAGRVVRKGDQGFLSAVLHPGMRAISVAITPVGGVAGFVFPGDRVDVIVTHQISRKTDVEQAGHKVSETMLVDVRVLALDQKTNDQAGEPKIAQTATLEVTPKQAETLALVSQLGTLSLALRSLANPDEPPGIGVSESAFDASQVAVGAKDATSGGALTWDSDVSQVLEKPGSRTGAIQRIQIMRGKDSTESIFDLQQ